MKQRIPARLEWATSIVAADGPNSVLEIGYGRGIAIERLAASLPTARIVGLDRSPVAFRAASLRNAGLIETGRCSLRRSDVLSAVLEEHFDAIVAINVNVFWMTRARLELALLQQWLAPAGRIYLFYETPPGAQRPEIGANLTRNLAESGLEVGDVVRTQIGGNAVIGVFASSPGTRGRYPLPPGAPSLRQRRM